MHGQYCRLDYNRNMIISIIIVYTYNHSDMMIYILKRLVCTSVYIIVICFKVSDEIIVIVIMLLLMTVIQLAIVTPFYIISVHIMNRYMVMI